MSHSSKISEITVGCRVAAGLLILAQIVACGPSIESGGGPETTKTDQDATNQSNVSSCECLAPYGGPALGETELTALRDEGLKACFHQDEPPVLDEERKCLPSVVGQYATGGHDIEVYYFCSDVCPDYGHVGIRFTGIKDTPSCCALGGVPLLDPAWGGFEACVPNEINPMVPWVDKCP